MCVTYKAGRCGKAQFIGHDPNTQKVRKNAIYYDKTQHVNMQHVTVPWCVCVCVCVCDTVLIAVCGTLINFFTSM